LLSDTHIDVDLARVARGTCMGETFDRVVREVVAEAGTLDGVIIDGDCAFNEGLPGDYETFAMLMKPLADTGLPIHMTLGNHDDRGPFYEALARSGVSAASPVEGKHVSVIEGGIVRWVLLDSLRFVNKVEGEFGKAQLEWLDEYLESEGEGPVILVGHHYPQVFRDDVIPGDKKIKISGLVDSEAFLELARQHPRVKAYIYGHSHDWKVSTPADGVHQVNLPPTAYVFDPKRPQGWVLATVGRDGMKLELRALERGHAQHGEVEALAWR
jgi:Icc protein